MYAFILIAVNMAFRIEPLSLISTYERASMALEEKSTSGDRGTLGTSSAIMSISAKRRAEKLTDPFQTKKGEAMI